MFIFIKLLFNAFLLKFINLITLSLTIFAFLFKAERKAVIIKKKEFVIWNEVKKEDEEIKKKAEKWLKEEIKEEFEVTSYNKSKN